MTDIQRYDSLFRAIELENGEFVKYDDHLKVVEDLQSHIDAVIDPDIHSAMLEIEILQARIEELEKANHISVEQYESMYNQIKVEALEEMLQATGVSVREITIIHIGWIRNYIKQLREKE